MMHGTLSSNSVALSVQGVSHSYGPRKALENVSFTLTPSTFTVLLGLNGAGKSTLFSLITRLYATRQGRISILGHDIERSPGAALRQLGTVFQSRTLDLDLSVMQNLLYHAALHGIGKHEARLRSADALARIALSDRAEDKVRSLSGGQMRRLEIARALLHRPRLLVLDEPTVGLDINSRADIISRAHQLLSEGVCVLWATHLVDEVQDQDDVIVLHHGRILAHALVPAVVAKVGKATDIRTAFRQMIKEADPANEAA
jgi:ABC-2 type transport system ATP-binding protein